MEILGLSASTPKSRSWILELLWPTVGSEVAAETASRNGLWVCFVIGAISALAAVGTLGFSMSSLLGAFFLMLYFLVLGIGVGAGSRVASLVAILYLLFSLAIAAVQGKFGVPILPIIAMGLLFGSLRAAVALRKFRRLALASAVPPDLPESAYRDSAPQHLRLMAEADERGFINGATRLWRRISPAGELILGSMTLLYFGLMLLNTLAKISRSS
jgi:hypothetical protein